MTGPSVEDAQDLRKIAFVAVLGAMVGWGILLFVGSGMFTLAGRPGHVEETSEDLGEMEVLVAEYLGEESDPVRDAQPELEEDSK